MEGIIKFFEGWAIPLTWFFIPVGFVGAIVVLWLFTLMPEVFVSAISWAFFFAPIWLPVALVTALWPMWIHYIQEKFIVSQNMILLEVRIPRDIMKSPRAMEAVFDGLHFGGGEGTFINRNIEGKVRPWWSFELASIEGQVHFYIWTRAGLRDVVEAQIYAQYPTVEIYEVEDYASKFHFDPEQYSLWACDFKLAKKDVYPIKTYIDYELDKDPKEELKMDPIANIFESLSAVGPGEQMWLQIIFRQNARDFQPKVLARNDKGEPEKFALFAKEKESRWKFEAKEEIEAIRKKATPTRKDKEGNEVPGFPNPTPGQIEQIKAIEKSIGKNGFDVGIRAIYVAKKDAFKGNRINMLLTIFKHVGSGNLNSFAPTGWNAAFKGYPWEDIFGRKAAAARAGALEAYKLRAWFYLHESTHSYVLTSEELATLYHFPSRTVQAPGLARIPATKAEAPYNLPV